MSDIVFVTDLFLLGIASIILFFFIRAVNKESKKTAQEIKEQ